jgi:UPF0755 protein
MLRGLKFCGIALIIIIIVTFLAVKAVFRVDSSLSSFWDNLLGNKKEVSTPIFKEEKTIRVIEGWRNSDIAKELVAQGLTSSSDFTKATWYDYSSQFDFLKDKHKGIDLEGYLYPDTYRVYASSTADEIIVKMLTNFDNKLTPQMRADIKAQGKTINEIITMASIIEKEAPISYQTGKLDDAKIVSGIFWNRIKSGQALQSCATLAYILGVNKPQYSEADTRIDSPYNTYQNPGLPPGPIANPGILAITAAIYPIKTNYNYFLTPSGSKELIFSRTYDEHLRNKNKYLK